jgi:anthraniloyl-CoA monooxygenase
MTVGFEAEIEDPRSLAAEYGMVIGADGINSNTRETFADEFGAKTIKGETRFSWFGTHADFEALSHIFVENEDGIWCAHTYPGEISTFIVDCDPETWHNARLDQLSESEYREYLEELFAEYLDGHELLSQIDRWQRFTTVQNEQWSHENLVLIGDAAHTAHYSIGSGTTMAMEDAISLANAIGDGSADVSAALGRYETERKPIARSLQRAGERSRIHFENIRRYYDLDGIQFAIHHLTRSGRLTYDSMARRDPDLVDELAVETGETARLVVEHQGHCITIYQASEAETTTPNTYAGFEEKPHSTAAGKAILAALPSEEAAQLLALHEMTARTERTITDEDRLYEELATVREQGYAVDNEECFEGWFCVADSIVTPDDAVIGAISVSAPVHRIDPESFTDETVPLLTNATGVLGINHTYSPWTQDGVS